MAFFLQRENIRHRAQQQLSVLDSRQILTDHHPSTSIRSSSYVSSGNEKQTADRNTDGGYDVPISSDLDSYATLNGITKKRQENGEIYLEVSWESESDSLNPRNWPTRQRVYIMLLLDLVSAVVTAASAVDSAVGPQAAQDLGVSKTEEAFGGTGVFLIGFGLGAFVAAPASEFLGRYLIYLVALSASCCWLIGAAMAPNYAAQIVFRFLAGFCSSAPLTVSGGSMSDLWSPQEMTWAFPLFAIVGFGGPVLGPVLASYIGSSKALSWRWADWLMAIAFGFVLILVLVAMRETLGSRLLGYKARHFRKLTGNDRFMTAKEAEAVSMQDIVKKNLRRPFVLACEPIVIVFTLYTSVVYTVLFTFLVGYTDIFGQVYKLSQGLTKICFLGLLVGIVLSVMLIPIVKRTTDRQLKRDGDDGSGKALDRESRLFFAMIGAPFMPVGLIWMGWTDFESISIWSPLIASGAIGFGTVCIFISVYTYVIDSYNVFAASALTFVTCIRYIAAGIMTVVGVPMYQRLGTHWTLTVLGGISLAITPLPYILYSWGGRIRRISKYAAE